MNDRDVMLSHSYALRQRIEKLRKDDPEAYKELIRKSNRSFDGFGWGASNDFLGADLYSLGKAVEEAEARAQSRPGRREKNLARVVQEKKQNTTARTIILVIGGVVFLLLGMYSIPLLDWGVPILVVVVPIALGVLLLWGAWRFR